MTAKSLAAPASAAVAARAEGASSSMKLPYVSGSLELAMTTL